DHQKACSQSSTAGHRADENHLGRQRPDGQRHEHRFATCYARLQSKSAEAYEGCHEDECGQGENALHAPDEPEVMGLRSAVWRHISIRVSTKQCAGHVARHSWIASYRTTSSWEPWAQRWSCGAAWLPLRS